MVNKLVNNISLLLVKLLLIYYIRLTCVNCAYAYFETPAGHKAYNVHQSRVHCESVEFFIKGTSKIVYLALFILIMFFRH